MSVFYSVLRVRSSRLAFFAEGIPLPGFPLNSLFLKVALDSILIELFKVETSEEHPAASLC